MRRPRKGETIQEDMVAIRIQRGISRFLEDVDPEALAELYNKYAVAGSGQIKPVDNESGDYGFMFVVIKESEEE